MKATKSVGQLHGGIRNLRKDPEGSRGSFGMVRCMSLTSVLLYDINHVDPIVVGKDWFDGTLPMNAMSTVVTDSVTPVSPSEGENEDKYLHWLLTRMSCSYTTNKVMSLKMV